MDKNRFSLLEDSSQNRLCFLCLKASTEICSSCSIPYCCQDHYQQHYDSNLDYCFPFRVLQKPEVSHSYFASFAFFKVFISKVGRYVVATRDLEPLDLIMLDDPVLLGLNHDSLTACVECMRPMDQETTCADCSLKRCCSSGSQGQNWHALECKIFQDEKNQTLDFYSLILPIRALQLKESRPEKWKRFSLLMDQDEDNRIESELLEQNKAYIETLKSLGYKNEDIMKVLGIIRMNSLMLQDPELQMHGITGRVVYPTLSYISHSCVCNARYKMSKKDHQITVRAQSEIKKGEEITIQYVSFMHGNLKRKKTFQKTWYFECKCSRCIDPSELNTFVSALKCQQCIDGFLLPSSTSKLSEWNCDHCDLKQNDREIKEIVDFCFGKLYEYNSNGIPDVTTYEELLEIFMEKLHPNHYMGTFLKIDIIFEKMIGSSLILNKCIKVKLHTCNFLS